MKLRIGTFNVENLLTRHRFEPGGRTETAAAMSLFHFPRQDQRDAVERSLAVALEDDKRQMTALAIAEAQADLWMLQEVDSLASLQAFFANYVHRIADFGYGHFALIDGNDRRDIDIGFAARRDLIAPQVIRVTSHKEMTFSDAGAHDARLAGLGIRADDKVFARDCSEVELDLGAAKLAIRIGAWAASGALNSIRIAKGKAAETKTRKKATYRGRHILLKRPSNLTAKQAFALDGMLANDADLREAYEAKERFFQIWDAPDRGSAEVAIDEWMETVPPQHRAAFKYAITALEDWREEVLTYWGEFPEISNAYTEAANGMAKIHKRKGRGYKFEVIRARVLIDMRTVTPTDFVKCHGCGIGFAAGILVAQEAVSIGRGRRKVHLTLCPNCMVRNQSGMMKLKHQPTFQSE